nr:hypothetical protein [Tanacetum cinerariifolium]
MTTTVVNNSLFRTFFEKTEINWNQLYGMVCNLRIVLCVKDKLPFLEQPILAMPIPAEGQVLPPNVLNTHTAWVKASKEIIGTETLYAQQADQELLQTVREFHACKQEEGQFNYNMHSMRKTVTELHAMLKLHEQTPPSKEVSPALHAIRAG